MNWLFGRKSAPDSVRPFVPAWLRGGAADEGFARSRDGMTAYVKTSGYTAAYRGGAWAIGTLSGSQVTVSGLKVLGARRPAIAAPTGGTTVDLEARATLGEILSAMREHGLIEM
jgi:hypothetical protein